MQRPPNPPAVGALMTTPEPLRAPISDLHPTQITLGLREVAQKCLRWRSRVHKAGQRLEAGQRLAPSLVAPVVRGPAGVLYLVDRHHHLRALEEEGVHDVLIRPIADFTTLRVDDFWRALDAKGWCHPYDAEGRRRRFAEIPSAVSALRDDPYRSLASALRRAGGFAKRSTPFSEFAWADFLRRRVPRDTVATDFEGALELALNLAGTPAARNLPGWKPDRTLTAGPTSLASPLALG